MGQLQAESAMLLPAFDMVYPNWTAGHRGAWTNVCLVCRDGNESDPQHSEGARYLPTKALQNAPAMRKLIEAFGQTNRVRLSTIHPGLLGWHPDAGVGVEETGRVMVHIPILTSNQTLLRVGDEILSLHPGVAFFVDVGFPHSVFNWGKDTRIHL